MLRAKVTIDGETVESLPISIDEVATYSDFQLDFPDGSYLMRSDLYGKDTIEWIIDGN